MEQTGQNWGQLLDYWLKLKPQKIINIEPVYELYDQSLLIEYLGSFYHKEKITLLVIYQDLRNFKNIIKYHFLNINPFP